MVFGVQLVTLFTLVFLSLYLLWVYFFSSIFIPSLKNNDSTKASINYSDAMKLYLILLAVFLVAAFNHKTGLPNYIKLVVLGLAIFGTYLFTNINTFGVGNAQILIVDMIWGTVVSVVSTFLATYLNSTITIASSVPLAEPIMGNDGAAPAPGQFW
jgi:uncharacterized membrane protein